MIKIFKKLFNTERPNNRDWEGWYQVEKYLAEEGTYKFKELMNTNYEKIKMQNNEDKH